MFWQLIQRLMRCRHQRENPPQLSLDEYIGRIFPESQRDYAKRFLQAFFPGPYSSWEDRELYGLLDEEFEKRSIELFETIFMLDLIWPPEEREEWWMIGHDLDTGTLAVRKADGAIILVRWVGDAVRDAKLGFLWIYFFGTTPSTEVVFELADSFELFITRLKMVGATLP